jgi:hypothetical protein
LEERDVICSTFGRQQIGKSNQKVLFLPSATLSFFTPPSHHPQPPNIRHRLEGHKRGKHILRGPCASEKLVAEAPSWKSPIHLPEGDVLNGKDHVLQRVHHKPILGLLPAQLVGQAFVY